jgi:hypothetical protein
MADFTSDAKSHGMVGSSANPVVSNGLVRVHAMSHNTADAKSEAGAGGVVAVAVGLPKSTVAGQTKAAFNGNITSADALTVEAEGDNSAIAKSYVLTIGAISGGGAKADATITSAADVEALVSAVDVDVTGNILVKATSTNYALTETKGIAVSAISISIFEPTTEISGATKASLGGTVTHADNITVQARGQNVALANGNIFSVTIIGGQGVVPDARVKSGADVVAEVASGAQITADGTILIDAGLTADGSLRKNHAEANAVGNSFGLISAGVLVTTARMEGDVQAKMDGTINDATSLTVKAYSHNKAVASTVSKGLGGFTVSMGAAEASVTGATESTGVGSIYVSGNILFDAHSDNKAEASSDVGTGGLLGAFTYNAPTATVGALTRAEFNGTVTGGDQMSVKANATNTAESKANVFSVSLLFAAKAGDADATISDSADTKAIIGSSASINGLSQKLLVEARSVNLADAKAGGKGGAGFADITAMNPHASDYADTLAELKGDVGTTHTDPVLGTVGDAGAFTIEVAAHGDDRTVAKVDTFGVGLLAVSTSTATSYTEPQVTATIGTGNITATRWAARHPGRPDGRCTLQTNSQRYSAGWFCPGWWNPGHHIGPRRCGSSSLRWHSNRDQLQWG